MEAGELSHSVRACVPGGKGGVWLTQVGDKAKRWGRGGESEDTMANVFLKKVFIQILENYH